MNIQQITVGELAVNCYLLCEDAESAVIDPGSDAELILKKAEENGCVITKILLTHGHFDHIGAVCDIAEKTGAKVYVHSGDRLMLTDNSCNLSFLTGEKVKPYTPDILLDGVEEISLGNSQIKVYHIPGHSEGSVTYKWENNIFCGDLLFRGSIGRFDFGDLNTELSSIKYLMSALPGETRVFPGHGEATTLGYEKKYNPYVMD